MTCSKMSNGADYTFLLCLLYLWMGLLLLFFLRDCYEGIKLCLKDCLTSCLTSCVTKR